MVQRCEELGFALESRHAFRVRDERLAKDFDRHLTVELGIASTINLTHTSGPYRGANLVRPEAGTGGERHRENLAVRQEGCNSRYDAEGARVPPKSSSGNHIPTGTP